MYGSNRNYHRGEHYYRCEHNRRCLGSKGSCKQTSTGTSKLGRQNNHAPGDKQPGATLSLPPPMASHRLLAGFNWSLERVWI